MFFCYHPFLFVITCIIKVSQDSVGSPNVVKACKCLFILSTICLSFIENFLLIFFSLNRALMWLITSNFLLLNRLHKASLWFVLLFLWVRLSNSEIFEFYLFQDWNWLRNQRCLFTLTTNHNFRKILVVQWLAVLCDLI